MTSNRVFNSPGVKVALGLIFVTVILVGLVILITGSDARSKQPPPRYPSLSYGIHAFLWWNAPTRSLDLENIRLMHFDYVKQIFGWADIQPDPNLPYNWQMADAVVNEVHYRGLKLIARIGKPPDWSVVNTAGDQPPINLNAFASFCGDLADRYKSYVAGYQVWNEPNLAREWVGRTPNPGAYIRLLTACYRAIKAADPNAIVISAGLAPTGSDNAEAMPDDRFLREMYTAGASQVYDVLGLNAPGYKSPPETAPDDPALQGNRWQVFRHVEDMRAIMVEHGDGDKQIALLEIGWTTDTRPDSPYAWHAVTDEQQAQYLVGAFRYAAEHWRPWVGLMSAIFMPDPDWTPANEEYWWSIAKPGNPPFLKQAFIDLANMRRYIDDKVIPDRNPGIIDYAPLPPQPAGDVIKFTSSTNRKWAMDSGTQWLLTISFFIHMVATVIWIGGLVLLTILVWPESRKALARADQTGALLDFLDRLRKRFYPLANFSLITLWLTGLFQMDKNIHYDGFLQFTNDWSRAILLKHVAVLGMMIVGGAMQFGVIPALDRASMLAQLGKDSPDLERLRQRERRLAAINCVLGVIVLFLTAAATAM